MEYEIGVKLDRIEQKLDLIMQKVYPEAFEEPKTVKESKEK